MKHKRIKPAKSKEQQAGEEGWIDVYAPKTIRGWNAIWVEEARGAREADGEKAPHRCIPAPTACAPRG